MPKFSLHKVDYELLKAIFASKNAHFFVVENKEEIAALQESEEGRDMAIISTEKFEGAVAYSTICNPNGTIRWLFRSDRKKAGFLRLYNANNLKGRLFKWLVQLLYFIGLKRLVKHGNIYVSCASESLCEKLEKSFGKKYSIFTGTLGPNRKLVIESMQGTQAIISKIPLSNKGEKLVENEAKILSKIKLPKPLMIAPKLLETGFDEGICVSNIEPKSRDKAAGLSALHIKTMQQFYQLNCVEEAFEKGNFYQKINAQFKQLRSLNIQQIKSAALQNLLQKLFALKDELTLKIPEKTSLMHGDFTPWNMFVSKGKLYVYDWELAVNDSPAFLDLIHYVFQNGVMVKQQNAKQILCELKKLEMDLQVYLPEWGLNFSGLLKWYLLFYASYYGNIYAAQGKLHYQAQNLLIVWEEVINTLVNANASFPKLEKHPNVGLVNA